MEKRTKGLATVGVSALLVATAVTLSLLGGPRGLTKATIKVDVPTGTYYPNAIFNVTITCIPVRPIKGWELQVNYNKDVLQVQSVTEGNFFSPYPTFFSAGIINNTVGYVKNLYDLSVGAGLMKNVTGSFITIKFKAINSGFSNITLTKVGITNATSYIPRNITNSSVRIYSIYDMNLDANVNIMDLLDVANHYGETGVIGWIKEDIDDSGFVNVFDLVLIATHWGTY
jgi:hypothetical protein